MDPYRSFREWGFAIFQGVFSASRVDDLLDESERLHRHGARFSETIDEGPTRWLVVPAAAGPVLRGLQNGHRISRQLDDVRTDRTVLDIVRPMLGNDIKSVVSTLFWKPPGEPKTSIAYHQDCAFRRPAQNYRRLAESYVQFGLALDPHGPSNGGLRVVAGSHKKGDLNIQRQTSILSESPSSLDLAAYGLDAHAEIDIHLRPGDVIAWSAYLLHGSFANTSADLNRRFFIVAYMRSSDCDVGDHAFRDGRACPWLGFAGAAD